MKRLHVLLFLMAVAPTVADAQSADWQKSWNETLAAAKKEGKVVVTGPPDAQVRQALPAAFEARYGIRMEYLSARGTDQANKLRREKEAGVFSVDAVIAGIQTTATVLYAEKMLAPLKPELILPEVTDGKNWKRGSLWFLDPEQQYVLRIFNTVREAFMVNTDQVKPHDLRSLPICSIRNGKEKFRFWIPPGRAPAATRSRFWKSCSARITSTNCWWTRSRSSALTGAS